MRIKQAITERFVALCKEANITPNELATRSGVTPSTVYSMLDPAREEIHITTIKKLCDGLDISIADFFDTQAFRELDQEIDSTTTG
jgi:DNA-binding Xre family transcriptional regulator